MSNKIKVAVVGVGNCASSLIQGCQFYTDNPQHEVGLMYPEIGGYRASDIEFVVGFDIDARKVGEPLRDAIFASPNCSMFVTKNLVNCGDAIVYRGPTFDGFAPHMKNYDDRVTFIESKDREITLEEYKNILRKLDVDVLLNYLPVGTDEGSKWYIENAIDVGVHIINCMPSYISTSEQKRLEQHAINNEVTIVGSDMRSAFGASRLSEIIQGALIDSGLAVTQHIQMNMAAGTTQGDDNAINGRTANTDFLNMAERERLKNKHISKENVLRGQSDVRGVSIDGTTMYAGPSLTVVQKPGGVYQGTDNKICNIDIVAYGFCNAKYELTARLSVQDSPNSGGIVLDAIRFCKVAQEMGIVGYLRGPSAWTQKTPPVQLATSDSKFECDALARRILTPMTENQLKGKVDITNLQYSFQKSVSDYE
jgi:myo-inositol-1-phosphate synthase